MGLKTKAKKFMKTVPVAALFSTYTSQDFADSVAPPKYGEVCNRWVLARRVFERNLPKPK